MIYILFGALLASIIARSWGLSLLLWFMLIGYSVGGWAGMAAGATMFGALLWSLRR